MAVQDIVAIISAIAAVVSSVTAIITVYYGLTEDKRKTSLIKKQKCDIVLIPTKEWDGEATYQKLMGELNGQNAIAEAHHQIQQKHNAIRQQFGDVAELQYTYSDANTDNRDMELVKQTYVDNSIQNEWFDGQPLILTDMRLNFLSSGRIYGVNIKADKSVQAARNWLIVTQYFKQAIITKQGKQKEKLFIRKMKKKSKTR